MTGRSGVRLAVGILAALAAGCGSSRPFQSGLIARAADKNPPGPIDTRYNPPAPPAYASSWPPLPARPPANPAATWPPPEYTRASYAEELGAGQPTGEPAPRPTAPPAVTTPPYIGGGADRADPNTRTRPTATGGVFDLGPNEMPIDRAVELARKIDQVNRENLALLARIRQLEAGSEARETAHNETLRDVQVAYDEVGRIKAEIQGYRKELAALKARMGQMEKDEAETLRTIIAAIEKLLQMAPDNGKK